MSTRIYNREITYFIQGEATQLIKIGKTSTAVSERIRVLQTGSPDRLKFMGVCFGPGRFESFLHTKFSEYRLHGEWFAPATEILNFITENCITDEVAFFHAYKEITQGLMSFDEALEIGTNHLKTLADKKSEKLIKNMYVNSKGVNALSNKHR